VLMLSAAVAATLAAHRRRMRATTIAFAVITFVFFYTTIDSIAMERPDGVKIAGIFTLGILLVSLASRVSRAFELRANAVIITPAAREILETAANSGAIRLIAHDPEHHGITDYREKLRDQKTRNHLPDPAHAVFLEVSLADTSDFSGPMVVDGMQRYGYPVLAAKSPAIANTIAAVLLQVRDETDLIPHVYFNWTEGDPIGHLLRFLIFGVGEIAPVTREVLRRAEPRARRRPVVHVG
jgi:hypothetical protein